MARRPCRRQSETACPSSSEVPHRSLPTTSRDQTRESVTSAGPVQISRLLSRILHKPRRRPTTMLTCRTPPSTTPRRHSRWHPSLSPHHPPRSTNSHTPCPHIRRSSRFNICNMSSNAVNQCHPRSNSNSSSSSSNNSSNSSNNSNISNNNSTSTSKNNRHSRRKLRHRHRHR